MSTEVDAGRIGPLYRAVWRWHFYAGLFTAPFLVILAVTGALYLFDSEIEGVVYRRLTHVEPGVARIDPSAGERAALAAFPGARVSLYEAPAAPDASAEYDLRLSNGGRRTVFVDPYRLQVLGSLDPGWRLMAVVSRIHGELMIGRVGDLLVELAACWAFVLLATGLYLWWPRGRRGVGVLRPRLERGGRRFWRELHAVPAAWNAPVVAFLILSGLPWSGFWGEQLARLGTLSPAMEPTPNFGAPAPAVPSAAPRPEAAHAHHGGDNSLPWTVRNGPPAPRASARPAALNLDGVVEAAAVRGMAGERLRIYYPGGPGEVWWASYVPDRAERQRTLYLDPATGAVLRDVRWTDYSAVGKATEFGVQTHMGEQFGLPNKLLMLASCLLLIATVVAGIMAWWRRRPRDAPAARLFAPPPIPGYAVPGVVIALAVSLGVVFPLVGASLMVAVIVDMIQRRLSSA